MAFRAAVLGQPIAHSLSPVLHRAAYAELGLTQWSYAAIECGVDALSGLVHAADPEVVGYSCTMPLKRAALAVADTASRVAIQIGAANTLLRTGDGWRADNTDWTGLRDAIDEADLDVQASVVILGAGGTAQAALAALPDAGKISVAVRDSTRTADLQATAERLRRKITVIGLDDDVSIQRAALVLSTLPVGGADRFARLPWRPGQAVVDVVYSPWPTPLAAAAREQGAAVVSGALMLLHQAARQVELMTGSTAPVAAMRAALRAAAPGCGV